MKYLRVEIINTDAIGNETDYVRNDVLKEGIMTYSMDTFSPTEFMDSVSAMEYFPTMHEINNLVIHKADYKKNNKLIHALIKLLCCMEEAQLSTIDFNYKKENERW